MPAPEDQNDRERLLFTSQLLHDVKNFISIIYGAGVLIQEESTCPAARSYVEPIIRSSDLLNRLLDDVLALNQVDLGQLSIRPSRVVLRRELEAILQPHRDRAVNKGLVFEEEFATGLPAEVEVDTLRLTQILSNVVSNAVKFTSRGEIRIQASYLENQVQIVVSDSGPGVAPTDVAEIFEPYRRSAQILLRQEGHGLGLALARRLARMLGGDVEFVPSQTPMPGAVFKITLRAPLPTI